MIAARARIHAMFPLDEHATTELDKRLDEHHVETLSDAIRTLMKLPSARSDSPRRRGIDFAVRALSVMAGMPTGEVDAVTAEVAREAAASTPLIVDRFDTATEPAPEEEQVFIVGAIDEHGRPVALLFDRDDRRKVGDWLAPDKVEGAPLDFFQPGHTYLHERLRWRFRCDAVTSRPDTGKRVAVGYSFFGHGDWQTGDMSEGIWAEGGWTDVTEAGGRDV